MEKRPFPEILIDSPRDQLMNWLGFSAKRDKTMLPMNFLVEPSQNCLIPDGDKAIPRGGTQKVFQGNAPVLNDGTIGGYVKFKNFYGVEMDVKAYRNATAGEQVLVLFNGAYVPITKSPNTALNGTQEIYFSTYSDTNLDLSLNKRIPRLCWVNGYEHTDGTGRVFSWTGGIGVIDTIAGNVITLPSGQTWRKLGFTENFPQVTRIYVTINGVEFYSTSVAELDTNTLTLNASPTAVAGDIVTSAVEVDELVAPMYMLRMSKNYMYYGNLSLRQWYMSNQFGRPAVTRVAASNASQDDITIDSTTSYSGTGRNIYKLIISSITPASDKQSFFSATGGSNACYFDTSGYSGSGKRRYRISIIADLIVTFTGGVTPAYTVGERIVGSISGAVLKVVDLTGAGAISVEAISGNPVNGETYTGQSSGVTSPAVVALLYANEAYFFRQIGDTTTWTQITGLAGMLPSGGIAMSTGSPFSLVDGLTFVYPLTGSNNAGDYYDLEIQTEAPDTFTWQKNNDAISADIDVSTTPITVADGIKVSWAEDTGHKVGDYWTIEANQKVERPWANFYYTIDFTSQQPIRRPGEGYVYDLPSNFWTMDTFEGAMYLNGSNGEWGYSNPTLSANLLSEDISFVPLKQVGSSKVLYPYLTGHDRNDMIYIDENRNLQSMGRKILLEKVQMDTMTNAVLNKFQSLSFLHGSIIFSDNAILITSPTDNTMMVWNERRKYWQPPQYVPNLGLLTVIGTKAYFHSYLDTATRSWNDETAEGDDGVEYEVIIQNSTYAHGDRWNKKVTNMGFWEGYVYEELPAGAMKMTALFGPDGCEKIVEEDIIPVSCSDTINNGVFGGAQNGNHQHGGDVTVRSPYKRFTMAKLGVVHFYFSSLRFSCRAKKHSYEVLSMGINLAKSKLNNKDYRGDEQALDDLLPL